MSKNEITIEDLAGKIDNLTNTVDELARMTANGFGEVKGEMHELRDDVNTRLNRLGNAVEDVKLRQDNVAYRFEVRDLENRVTRLEKKAKFT